MKRFAIIIFIFLLLNFQAFAGENCELSCGYDSFFKESYEGLLDCLQVPKDCRGLFDSLFNAYSIKFKTFDMEYMDLCKKLNKEDCSRNEIKKGIKNLTEMALEEYDSLLDDISFEICGSEDIENKTIKKARTKLRRPLKKLITANCRKCTAK